MRNGNLWRALAVVGTTGGLLLVTAAGGCGKSRDDGNDTPPPPVAPPSPLNIQIQGVEVPAGAAPSVTFRVTDAAGAPIDLIQEIRNGAATPPVAPRTTAPRFTLAQLGDSGDYLSAYDRSIAGKPFTPAAGAGAVQPALANATQAVADAVPAADPALSERLVSQGNGVYRYTFAAPPNRTDLDRTKTWTVGTWATRTLPGDDPGHPANGAFNFVPDGGSAQRYEVVRDDACNVCHGRLEAHDRRTGTQLCITCHTPQTVDPETGASADFKVMVHRIHMGADLPSVRAGGENRIVGFAPGNPPTFPASAVHDFSEVHFPRSIHDCSACHVGEDSNRAQIASEAACLSCHDNVRFQDAGGLAICEAGGAAPCRHPIDISPGTNCANCHNPARVALDHQNPLTAPLSRFRYEIVNATVDANRQPVVQFRVVNPAAGNAPYDIKTAPEFTAPAGASSLVVDVAWATDEITNAGSGRPFGQPIAMNALTTATPVEGQPGVFQVTTAAGAGGAPAATVPPGVETITVAVEGHPAVNGVRIPVTNAVRAFALGGGAAPARRQVVSVDKCNACHGQLTAHGANRSGTTEVCAMCHNPNATDRSRRPSPLPAGAKEEEAIDFKVMVHEIHANGVRENDVTIFGFGGTPHVFPIGTGNVANCSVCHVGTSFQIPLPAQAIDTTVSTGADPASPDDNLRVSRTIAVCSSCHDRVRFDVPAGPELGFCNQTASGTCAHTGGPQPNDQSCVTCHGAGRDFAVEKVHPVTVTP